MSTIIWLVAASALLGGLFIAAVEFSGGAQTTGIPVPNVGFERIVGDAEKAIAEAVGVFESGIDAVTQLLPGPTDPPPEEFPDAAIDNADAAAPPSSQPPSSEPPVAPLPPDDGEPDKPSSDRRQPDDDLDQPSELGTPSADVETPSAVQICHVVSAGDSRLLSTILVADSAVSTHLKHGDTLGRCQQ